VLLASLSTKVELILKKLEDMESRCLMHKLFNEIPPRDLLRVIAAVRTKRENENKE
jgi:hypothetical protein